MLKFKVAVVLSTGGVTDALARLVKGLYSSYGKPPPGEYAVMEFK